MFRSSATYIVGTDGWSGYGEILPPSLLLEYLEALSGFFERLGGRTFHGVFWQTGIFDCLGDIRDTGFGGIS